MSRGKRFENEQKLNIKKVMAVVITIVVLILFFMGIKKMLKKETTVANSFSEISYVTICENGKWGVMNSKGDIIIQPSSEEMIIVPNSKKDVFISMYDVDYNSGTYKTKAFNSKNEQLFTNYANVEAISNYDNKNNIWYEANTLKVEKDGKYGLIDLNGNEILSCVYDKIDTLKGIENSILVKKGESYGLVNASGNIIVEPNYQQVTALTEDYSHGYIVKNTDGYFGVIGIDKTQVLDCKYSDIKHTYGNGMYVVKQNDKWTVVKNSQEEGKELTYSDIKSINDDNLVFVSNEKYGIIDLEQTEKVKAEYDLIKFAFSDYYIAKKDGKYGVINSSGETMVAFEYNDLTFNKDMDCLVGTKSGDENTFLIGKDLELKVTGKNISVSNGYIRANVNGEYKLYNLKFEEKSNREAYPNNTLFVAKNDGKYGLVNKDGTLVVSYQYEDITEQNEYGYVAVKKDGKWGVIDQYGNNVVDPKFDLTDVSNICVIGKWHLVENVNTTYFENK